MILCCASIVPSVSSSTPTPTFDFLNVPGDNETIEEAYSWIKEGGTIMVASGTHLVSLSINREVSIVSAGGAGSTTLRPKYPGSTLFSTNAPCTISGFTVEGNGSVFVAASTTAHDVIVSENVINNATVLGRCIGFVFTKNIMDGDYAYRYLTLSGEGAQVTDNDFLGEVELRLEGNNCTLASNSFDDCGVRITGDHNKLDRNLFEKRTRWWAIWSDARYTEITNNTFADIPETCLESLGFFETVADNTLTDCNVGLYLKSPGGSSKVARNNFTDCLQPIYVLQRDYDLVQDNEVWSSTTPWNSGGISVSSCSEVAVTGNVISRALHGLVVAGDNCTVNQNRVAHIGRDYIGGFIGIYTYFSDGEVKANTVTGVKGQGLTVGGSRNLIEGNLVQDCEEGIDVYGNTKDNQFIRNDLIGNNQSCCDISLGSTWDFNLFSDYVGPDNDRNGIGDLPYLIPGYGAEDAHPRIYEDGGTQVGEVNLGILPVTFPESPEHAGKLLIQSLEYYEELGEKVAEYYEEVSYGSLKVSVQVLHKPDGSMFSLAQESAAVATWTIQEFVGKVVQAVDASVDFRPYDYDPAGGKGVVAFVAPGFILKADNPFASPTSSYFIGAAAAREGALNADGTSIDAILTFAQSSQGSSKVIRPMAHEFAHGLGKLLVSSVSGTPGFGGYYGLPDEYFIGNVQAFQSLMGKQGSPLLEKVHLDAFSKHWLNWLQWEEMEMGQNYVMQPLSGMSLGNKIPVHSYVPDIPFGAVKEGMYVLEYRSGKANTGNGTRRPRRSGRSTSTCWRWGTRVASAPTSATTSLVSSNGTARRWWSRTWAWPS